MESEAQSAAAEPAPSRACPRCEGDIDPDAPEGLCPRCLITRVIERPRPGAGAEPPGGEAPRSPSSLRFGEYEILGRLGEGGMGVVYRARQVRAGRVVALKMLSGGPFASEEAVRRFRYEIEAAAGLDHPGIVPIYDVGEHEGRPYFTMKLLSGGTLTGRLADYSDPRRAAPLVATIARAVHEGHRQGLLHRDLKPENILFDEAGKPHVADFGVAKHLGRDGDTRSGDILGSPGYMAPEQAVGDAKRVTAAADVWSLGVMLYELLTGHRPFAGPTPMESIRRAIEEEPAPPRSLRRELPRDLETICLTCLHKDPARRYGSAEALAGDLERWRRGEPIEARRPGLAGRALRWCARYPAATALLLAAAIALSGAVATARAQREARRREVLEGNTYAARAVAGAVLAQLWQYGVIVAGAAGDPRAAALLERPDIGALAALRDAYLGEDRGSSPLTTWFVIGREGGLLSHLPMPKNGEPRGAYDFRDYFMGARSLAGRPELGAAYVSRAFQSETDGHYKFAFAAPIRDAGGLFSGVLVVTVATDSRLGALRLSDGRRLASLAARRDRERGDAEPPGADDFMILIHEGLAHGETTPLRSEILSALLPASPGAGAPAPDQLQLPPPDLVQSMADWRDPLAARDPDRYGGAWLAGFAPVGHTELVVIVQSRADEATALDADPSLRLVSWSGFAVALLGLAFAAASAARRRARAAG